MNTFTCKIVVESVRHTSAPLLSEKAWRTQTDTAFYSCGLKIEAACQRQVLAKDVSRDADPPVHVVIVNVKSVQHVHVQ